MKKLLLAAPVFLLATVCSDITLEPFWSKDELPGGPALGLRDIDYASGTVRLGFATVAGGPRTGRRCTGISTWSSPAST
jgi:hypothetical protein